MWASGVTLRWTAGVYEWHWRVLLPLSAGLEIAAFLIFFPIVSQPSQPDPGTSQSPSKLDRMDICRHHRLCRLAGGFDD